jgi:aspartyl aminopeptidase
MAPTDSAFDGFQRFMADAPTPYHVVDGIRSRLLADGFVEVHEHEGWTGGPGARQFLVRSGKTIAAWITGTDPADRSGLRIVGAHTDSPCLKPRATTAKANRGTVLLDTSVYGSPILQTWLDRDLAIAGAVFTEAGKAIRLVDLPDPAARISTLAIHLDKSLKEGGLKPNPHTQLACHLGARPGAENLDLVEIIASQMGIERKEIAGADLFLYDPTPPARVGHDGGLLSSGRLDNLFSCHCAMEALCADPEPTAATRIVALFDAEEIGSRTSAGAQSTFLTRLIRRIVAQSLCKDAEADEAVFRAAASSYFLSLDMAHGFHALYPNATDDRLVPELNGGPAIKISHRGHYAMSPKLEAMMRAGASEREIPLQSFAYRNDLGGGSSSGPFGAAQLGMESIDAGAPLLGMHSIRELGGLDDLSHTTALLRDVFFSL